MDRLDIGHPVIMVPGLGGSGAGHWQSWLERVVENTDRLSGVDWERPELTLWLERLQSVLAERPDSILVAHSLGCALVAHAARSHPGLRASGALLVAPADVDASPAVPETLHSFADVPRRELPFPSIVIASTNDPYMTQHRAEHFASTWGSRLINLGAQGHINVASGFGPWPDGLKILHKFARDIRPQTTSDDYSLQSNETERA